MNLHQAYQGWKEQSENRELYVNTREAFRKAWFTLPTNKPCSYYTREVLGEALAATREIQSNKAKAASVMCHVLSWAHWAEPKFNPELDFTFNDLMEYTKGPLAKPNKTKTQEKPSCLDDYNDDNDLDIDPVTAKPRKAMNQDQVQPENHTDETGTKEPKDMEPKKPRGKQPKPVVQIDPKTLQMVKQWPSITEAQTELGVFHIDKAITKLRKAGGFYWSLAVDADTFQQRIDDKVREIEQRQKEHFAMMREKKAAKETKPSPDEVPVSVAATVQAPMPKFKGGDHVWVKDPKEQYGRTGYIKAFDSLSMMYYVWYGEEIWKISEKDLELVDESKLQQKTVPIPEGNIIRNDARKALETFTDDELLNELDRRGFIGELRRTQIFTIGAK